MVRVSFASSRTSRMRGRRIACRELESFRRLLLHAIASTSTLSLLRWTGVSEVWTYEAPFQRLSFLFVACTERLPFSVPVKLLERMMGMLSRNVRVGCCCSVLPYARHGCIPRVATIAEGGRLHKANSGPNSQDAALTDCAAVLAVQDSKPFATFALHGTQRMSCTLRVISIATRPPASFGVSKLDSGQDDSLDCRQISHHILGSTTQESSGTAGTCGVHVVAIHGTCSNPRR